MYTVHETALSTQEGTIHHFMVIHCGPCDLNVATAEISHGSHIRLYLRVSQREH